MNNESLIQSLQEQNSELIKENQKLVQVIEQIITLTYEREDSAFETIVFQRFGLPPMVVYKKLWLDFGDAKTIDVRFTIDDNGECISEIITD